MSATLQELSAISPDTAQKTLERLRDGYTDKSGASYPPATTNNTGCILAMKTPNRSDNGYVQIAPIVKVRCRVKKGQLPKKKPKPQNAHRLAVVAYKSPKDVKLMIDHSYHASHLCHNPNCINPNHIVVESKDKNEARKPCKLNCLTIRFSLHGDRYEAKPLTHHCNCLPPCISRIEERTVEKLEK